jgi:TPR repeat protein
MARANDGMFGRFWKSQVCIPTPCLLVSGMTKKQFSILIGAGILCAMIVAAPALYRVSKEFKADNAREMAGEPKGETSRVRALADDNSDAVPSLKKYQELKLEQVRERSVRGDALAQYELGRRYDTGEGVDEDDIEAMKWYLSAAKLGVPEAQLTVGHAYELGWLQSKAGKQEAFHWYELAAKQGLVEAQAQTAQHYFEGNGVAKNEGEAEKWLRKAAENGHPQSAFKFAEITFAKAKTDKSNKSVEEGLVWMRKAADLGYGEAQFNMGSLSLFGPYMPQDLSEAASWWKKAAASGNTEAQSFISEEFHRNQPTGPYMDQRLVMLYIKATEKGDAEAEWEIGRAYANGSGVIKENKSEAANWFRKAADKGHVTAQCNLADAYLAGEGVEKNPAIAFELFEQAANRGRTYAQISLAHCFEDGVGCKTDLIAALMWGTIASLAEQNQQSMTTVMWLRSGLPSLKSRMTPEQIKTAEVHAREWHPTHAE